MKKLLSTALTIGLLCPAQAQLVAYWNFDTDFLDSTGNHNGTAQNGAILTTGDQGFGGGEALSLSGGSGATAPHVTVADPTTLDFDTDFTWHAYVKSASAAGGIFGRAPATPNIHNQGSKSLFFGGGNAQWDTGWVGAPSSNTPINDDTWHQVIVTFVAASDQLDIFVDPVAGATTGQYSGVHDVNRFDESIAHNDGLADSSFRIGHVSDNFRSEAIVGLIDEAAIFDIALSGAELDQLITLGPGSFVPSGVDPQLLAPPTLTLDATSIASGATTRSITIRNAGVTQDLTISGVSFTGGDAAMFSPATLPDPVGPETSVDLQINFNPTATGTFSTTMEISSNDANSPKEIMLTIEVVLDPFFNPGGPLALEAVTAGTGTIQRAVEVTNSGLVENLTITSVNFTGGDSSVFSNAVFPTSIAPGASGTITFDVDSANTPGDYSAVMAIASNAETSPTTNVDLSIVVLTPSSGTMVAYWSFDQDASDRLGNHDGTLKNGAMISTGGQGFGGGEALALGGGTGATAPHVTTANPEIFDFNSDFTWHAYVKSSSAAGGIFGRAPASPVIHNQGSKSLFFGGGNAQWDTGWVGAPSSNVPINDDEWHQVIVTFVADTDQLDIFVDPEPGATVGQYSGIHDVNRFDEMTLEHNGGIANTSFRIGHISDNFRSEAINGLIDEAAVFDTALNGDQLDQLITSGPASFAGDQTIVISAISVAGDPRQITLTWNSRNGETFAVIYSTDLQDWDSDLDDGIVADEGDSTTRTFDVEGLDGPDGKLYVRVVKQ